MTDRVLIDGHNLLYRAYHARAAGGKAVTAAEAAVQARAMILRYVRETTRDKDRALVAVDGGDSGRTARFPAYKAGRARSPQAIRDALPLLLNALHDEGIRALRIEGYEADDVIATVSNLFPLAYSIAIVSSDRDLLQLLQRGIVVHRPGHPAPYDAEQFIAEYGFGTKLLPDYKALVGDKSDNLPGVPMLGPVRAKRLLAEVGGVDHIYGQLWRVGNQRLIHELRRTEPDVRLRRDLATLRRDVPGVAEALAALRGAA